MLVPLFEYRNANWPNDILPTKIKKYTIGDKLGLGSDLDVSVVCSTSTEMPIGQMSIGQMVIGQMTYHPQKSRDTLLVGRVGLGSHLGVSVVGSTSRIQ